MCRPHGIVGNPDYTGRSITLLIKRTSYIINGRSALSAPLKCVDFGLKSTVWLTDWLTSPERCWKQSISSGHCSNDRDVCTPSGRAVRSMDHCHADIHTHTHRSTHTKWNNTSANKICCHFACAHTIKLSNTQTVQCWQTLVLLLSCCSLWILPRGLTCTHKYKHISSTLFASTELDYNQCCV